MKEEGVKRHFLHYDKRETEERVQVKVIFTWGIGSLSTWENQVDSGGVTVFVKEAQIWKIS